MKASFRKTGLFIALMAISFISFTQTAFQSTAFDIRLTGTSNIHDWEMKANAGKSQATFVINSGGQLTALNGLSFQILVCNPHENWPGL